MRGESEKNGIYLFYTIIIPDLAGVGGHGKRVIDSCLANVT